MFTGCHAAIMMFVSCSCMPLALGHVFVIRAVSSIAIWFLLNILLAPSFTSTLPSFASCGHLYAGLHIRSKVTKCTLKNKQGCLCFDIIFLGHEQIICLKKKKNITDFIPVSECTYCIIRACKHWFIYTTSFLPFIRFAMSLHSGTLVQHRQNLNLMNIQKVVFMSSPQFVRARAGWWQHFSQYIWALCVWSHLCLCVRVCLHAHTHNPTHPICTSAICCHCK